MGIAQDELDQVWAFIGGMLYLGNVKFGDGDNAKIDALSPSDPLRVAEGRVRSRHGHRPFQLRDNCCRICVFTAVSEKSQREREMMMPFCVETESVGSPASCHWRSSTG